MEDKTLEKIDWDKARAIFTPDKETFLVKAQKTWEKYPEAREALSIVAAFGAVSLAMVMPGLAKIIAWEIRDNQRTRYRRMWRRFVSQKLVKISETKDGPVVEITEDGIKRALQYKLDSMRLKKPKQWDGKWRLVIFDVHENKRGSRDRFRGYLQRLGFYMLNESVFVHPYPSFDEVEFLRQLSGIGPEVTYIVAESIETNIKLKSHFDLK